MFVACGNDPAEGSTGADASSVDAASSGEPTTTDDSSTTDDPSDGSSGAESSGDPCAMPDRDGDGHEDVACGGDDCDDADAFVHPGIEYDGWMQLSLHPFEGGGQQYHSWLVGSDGLVDIFWAFNGNLWNLPQHDDISWSGPMQVGFGSEPRVALGLDGAYHMVFVGFDAKHTSRGAFYTKVGSPEIFAFEELPIENPNPFGLDIAIDASTGTMHVVYGVLYEFPPTLRYATSEDGKQWTIETIAEESAGFGGTIVLGDDGVPHVSFASNENEVMHGARVDGSWTVEVAASGYEVGATSMARDAAGDLHIAFSVTGLEDADDGLHYVRTENGEWGDAVEIDGDVVWWDEIGAWDYRVAIAVNDRGVCHIAYHDHGAGVLRYAALVDGTWLEKVVDDATGPIYPQAGWYPQIDLQDGVVYFSETSEATNEYKRIGFVPDDGLDNDCDGAIDEGL